MINRRQILTLFGMAPALKVPLKTAPLPEMQMSLKKKSDEHGILPFPDLGNHLDIGYTKRRFEYEFDKVMEIMQSSLVSTEKR